MINLSVRKYASIFKPLNEQQSIGRMLLLATAVHLLLLFSLELEIPSASKMLTSMLDVTLQASVDPEEPELFYTAQQKTLTEIIDTLPSKENRVLFAQAPQLPMNEKLLEPISQTSKLDQPAKTAELTRKRTISAASHESKDAAYLSRWQSYVEEFGNHHYPQIALKNNLRGELRLLVAVKKDGTVHEVSIRQSSGYSALDQAAIEIVYNAAPFEPLPNEIAKDIEVLEIIRTWQFRGKLSTSV